MYDLYRKCYRTPSNHSDIINLMNIETNEFKNYATINEITPWLGDLMSLFSIEDFEKSEFSTKFSDITNMSAGQESSAPPCVFGESLSDWLNKEDVRSALGIP